MIDIVKRLRTTLTGADTDEAMWKQIVTEREEAARVIVDLRLALAKERSKRGYVSAEISRLKSKGTAQ